ncbi:MAG: TetR/AcrR family transcriptional regulator [Polyangiales bacterium]
MSRPRRAARVDPPRAPTERPGREGGRRDANRKARTAAIGRAALKLFLERGTGAVSIDDIASEAGVAKGSFYTYFHDKTDVVRALLEPVRSQLESVLSRCEPSCARPRRARRWSRRTRRWRSGARSRCWGTPTWRGSTSWSAAPRRWARAPFAEMASMLYERGERVTEAAQAHGLLRPLDPRVTATAVIGAAQELLHRALSNDDIGPPEAVPDALVTMVVDGLARRVE